MYQLQLKLDFLNHFVSRGMVAIPSQNIYIDWKKVIVHFRKSAGLVPTTTTPWREFPARSGRTRLQSSPGSPWTPQRRPTEDICRPCGQNEKVCQLLCYSSYKGILDTPWLLLFYDSTSQHRDFNALWNRLYCRHKLSISMAQWV